MNPFEIISAAVAWVFVFFFFVMAIIKDDDNYWLGFIISIMVAGAIMMNGYSDWEAIHHPTPPNLEQSTPNTGPTHIPKSP